MWTIKGAQNGRHRTVQYEARQLDEGWEVIIRCAGFRIDETTLAVSPWTVIERLIAEALDTSRKQASGSNYDMDRPKKAASQVSERKRRTKLPQGSLPDSQIGVDAHAQLTEALNAKEQANG